MTYGLGRGLEYYDMPVVRMIARGRGEKQLPVFVYSAGHREKHAVPNEEDARNRDASGNSAPELVPTDHIERWSVPQSAVAALLALMAAGNLFAQSLAALVLSETPALDTAPDLARWRALHPDEHSQARRLRQRIRIARPVVRGQRRRSRVARRNPRNPAGVLLCSIGKTRGCFACQAGRRIGEPVPAPRALV